MKLKDLEEISPGVWEIPRSHRSDMRCAARVYISREGLEDLLDEKSLEQLVNITTLPGIEYAAAMPDIHQGYGFPIGGVAAIRSADGVISPGGVGYDVNCGVRLLVSPFARSEIEPRMEALATQMQRDVPSGVGRGGSISLDEAEMDKVLNQGVGWALNRGLALPGDSELIEELGCYDRADARYVSKAAKQRGADQLGTIGSGNHFLEIQEVTAIFDPKIAAAYGLAEGRLVVMIHTGSRGLGHQVCTDYVRLMNQVRNRYGITLPDRELCCAPFYSDEGQRYFKAMAAAANFAWVNRQVITHRIRGAWKQVLGEEGDRLKILYDVAHNIAKLERHKGREYILHRKGATRAFGPGSHEIPAAYREVGQPVLIPGSMGTSSYVLAGTAQGMVETFGSSCHGAGRRLSRTKAKKSLDYNLLRRELSERGVVVRAGSPKGLLEEAPAAYKDVDDVVRAVKRVGLAAEVARLKPLAVIKG